MVFIQKALFRAIFPMKGIYKYSAAILMKSDVLFGCNVITDILFHILYAIIYYASYTLHRSDPDRSELYIA